MTYQNPETIWLQPCGFLRRIDDRNPPCKGRVGIALRDPVSSQKDSGNE